MKALQHAQELLRRANKALSRTKKGSVGRRKAARRLGKAHARVAALRNQFLHALTTQLVRENSVIVIEDLNAAGMLKNNSLARHLSDAAFGDFRRMLTYKAQWFGTEVVVADRWFASSKTCSSCGSVAADLTLADRAYRCVCGLEIDRDLNAAINLARWEPPAAKTSPPPLAAA